MKNLPTTEERIWSVLAHLSALAFGMGILLPVVGWSEQRRKSEYASFQCLQALGYQSLGYTVWILISLIVMIFVVIIMLVNIVNAENVDLALGVWLSTLFIIMMGLLGLYILLPVVAAISCVLGKEYHYPIMGKRLARYLGYDMASEQESLIEESEDRWVAAMGHFNIIVLIWGMLAPLTSLILQGRQSFFLKFQSLQTLVYQACVTLLFFGTGFISAIGIGLLPISIWAIDIPGSINYLGVIGMVFLLLILLFAFALTLIMPLFHILGQWAGYRVLKGDDYHYPIIGKLVEKRISKTGVEENQK